MAVATAAVGSEVVIRAAVAWAAARAVAVVVVAVVVVEAMAVARVRARLTHLHGTPARAPAEPHEACRRLDGAKRRSRPACRCPLLHTNNIYFQIYPRADPLPNHLITFR